MFQTCHEHSPDYSNVSKYLHINIVLFMVDCGGSGVVELCIFLRNGTLCNRVVFVVTVVLWMLMMMEALLLPNRFVSAVNFHFT